jgi:hypothetical protein
MSRFLRGLFTAIACGMPFSIGPALAEESPAKDSKDAPASNELQSESHKAVVAQMKQILVKTKLVRHGAEPVVAELVPEPILNWDDLARGHHHGTLWVWGERGRPAAIIEMYTLSFSRRMDRWPGTVVHSLSAEPLTAEGRRWDWSPEKPGFTPEKLKDVAAPGATRAARQREMRALAKRYSSNETLFGDRAELRLLTTPVRLYDAADDGLLDGGLFVFVHGGTNPEVVLILEAMSGAKENFWQFGLVRLTHAQAQVKFDEREVWNVESYGESNPKSSYYWLQPYPGASDRVRLPLHDE